MDQLILAARDVVEAWDNHTLELDVAIRRLAEALGDRAAETQIVAQGLSAAGVG
ncbi:MAG TPA: hypothetical protein VGL20_06320 [Candidatus Dormibacteraeota bacterium]|jgi:hypothetical protein